MSKLLTLLILSQLLQSCPASAADWGLLELDSFSLEYRKHINYRDEYFSEYETVEGRCTGFTQEGKSSKECMLYGANALFNLNMIRYNETVALEWNSDVHMDATNAQVRHVAWRWDLGLKLGQHLWVGHRHESRHILDVASKINYPLRDEYVLRVNVYQRK